MYRRATIGNDSLFIPNDRMSTKAKGANLAMVPNVVMLPVLKSTSQLNKYVSVEKKYVDAADIPSATNIQIKTFGKKLRDVIPAPV